MAKVKTFVRKLTHIMLLRRNGKTPEKAMQHNITIEMAEPTLHFENYTNIGKITA